MKENLTIQDMDARKWFEKAMFISLRDKDMPLCFKEYYTRRIKDKKGIDAYFGQCRNIAEELAIKGKEVLFVGCGLGMRAIIFALLGAGRVVGVDLYQKKIESLQKMLDKIDPLCNVFPICGDCLEMENDEACFDVVILIESISHIRDTELLIRKINFVMKPGGFLYICDNNNNLHLPTRLKQRKIWRTFENGPFDISSGCRNTLTFFEMRKKIILQKYPVLDNKLLEIIARKTQGLYGKQIIDATSKFLSSRKITVKPNFPYRDPYTGVYPELGINYLSLKRLLAKYSFSSRRIPHRIATRKGKGFIRFFKELVKRIMNSLFNKDFIGIFFEREVKIKAEKSSKTV